jgi:hypothetical protein
LELPWVALLVFHNIVDQTGSNFVPLLLSWYVLVHSGYSLQFLYYFQVHYSLYLYFFPWYICILSNGCPCCLHSCSLQLICHNMYFSYKVFTLYSVRCFPVNYILPESHVCCLKCASLSISLNSSYLAVTEATRVDYLLA